MTHLRIIQNNGVTEEVSSSVILKLYELATSGDLDNTSVLLGRINASIVKDIYLDYFMPLSGTKPYPEFYVSGTNIAVTFADPEVERVLLANNIGSNGYITEIQLGALSYIGDRWFKDNTTVTSFNEISKCSNNNTIGTECFLSCTNLTSVDLSKTQTIKPSAFRNCSKLTSIGGLQLCTSIQNMAFANTKISSIDLSNVTTLLYLAFDGCTSLSMVTLPSTLTSIPQGCFKGCTNLSTIDLSNITSIDGSNSNYGAFQGCTSLTSVNLSSCTSLGQAIFRGCTALTSVDLSSCTTLSAYAFDGCTSLTTIDLSNVTTINERSFRNCTGLTTITLSNSLTTIPNYCFSGDTALTTINGGTGITIINEGAFLGCSNLIKTFDFTNTFSIAREAFKNCSKCTFTNFDNVSSFGSNCLLGCTISGSYSFKDGVSIGWESFKETSIQGVHFLGSGTLSHSAFGRCRQLTSIVFDGDVKLGAGCFNNCTNLLSVDLSNISNASLNDSSTGYIGGLFSECSNLSQIILNPNITTIPQGFAAYNNSVPLSITIPASVTSIGANAFYAAKVDMTILATTPPAWGNNTSLSRHAVSIKVPNGCLSAYLSASGWSTLADKMSELPA